jgi:hypothetical protein
VPSFLPPVTYPVGALTHASDPDAIAVGDFTGTGVLDLVTANSESNTVTILRGNGDGTFQPADLVGEVRDPDHLVVDRFRGPTFPLDIVTANSEDNSITIFLGNGDGTFKPPTVIGTVNDPEALTVGDFNGDGMLDLVSANSESNSVTIFLGNGDGTFQPPKSVGDLPDPDYVAAGVFTSDGKLDLVTANSESGSVTFLKGNGDGTFQSPVFCCGGVDPDALAVGEFDGDGYLDFVCVNSEPDGFSNVTICHGNGDGTFGPISVIPISGDADHVAVAHFRGPTLPLDIVTANSEGNSIGVLLGNGDGSFVAPKYYSVGDSDPDFVAIGAFTSSSLPDVATANSEANTVSVLINDGMWPPAPPSTPDSGIASWNTSKPGASADAGRMLALPVASWNGLTVNPSALTPYDQPNPAAADAVFANHALDGRPTAPDDLLAALLQTFPERTVPAWDGMLLWAEM